MSAPYSAPRLPLGVAILAVLVGIVGFILTLGGAIELLWLALHVGASVPPWVASGLFGALVTFVVGLVLLAVAFGLWDQELWALVIALLAGLAFLVLNVGVPIYRGASVSQTVLTLPALLAIVLVVYLFAVSGDFY